MLAAITQAPVLRTPPNGTVLQNMGAITLSFELPAGTTQYHIQLIPFNGDGPGANLIRNPESSFTLLPPTLGVGPYVILPGMTYTWRLRATDKPTSAPELDPSWGPWSDPFSFTTPPPSADSIRPTNPPIGVTVTSLNPTLTWSDDNPFIFYYEIDVAKDRLFDRVNPIGPIFSNYVHGGESRPFNSWVVPQSFPLEPGCTYYWRVRPRVQGNGTPVNWPLPFVFKAPSRSAADCTPVITPPPPPVGGTTPPPATGDGVPFTLIVTRAGTGSGSVTSLPQGITCPIDCSEAYAKGTVVVLTATPTAGWAFNGWSGDADCSDGVVTMNATTSCIAIFGPPTQTDIVLTITKAGGGNGTVTSSIPGINCGVDCTENYTAQAGASITLTAIADSGSRFDGWTGDPDCSDGVVTMSTSKTCTAIFTLVAPPTPAVAPPPTNTPTPSATPTATSTPTPAATATVTPSPTPAVMWVQQASCTGSRLNGVTAAGSTAWAVGDGGVICNTTNGGASWSAQSSGTGVDLYNVSAANSSTAWAVGQNGTVIKTTNGGASWASQSGAIAQVVGGGGGFAAVTAINADSVWVAGDNGKLANSTSGGAAWTNFPPQTAGVPSSAVFLGAANFGNTNAYFVGAPSMLALTAHNNGTTWSVANTGGSGVLSAVATTSSNGAVAVGTGGVIVRTTDAGASWSRQSGCTSADLRGVTMVDSGRGWAVGAGGAVCRTSDGGTTWTSEPSGVTSTLIGVANSSGTIWAVGDGGRILRRFAS